MVKTEDGVLHKKLCYLLSLFNLKLLYLKLIN